MKYQRDVRRITTRLSYVEDYPSMSALRSKRVVRKLIACLRNALCMSSVLPCHSLMDWSRDFGTIFTEYVTVTRLLQLLSQPTQRKSRRTRGTIDLTCCTDVDLHSVQDNYRPHPVRDDYCNRVWQHRAISFHGRFAHYEASLGIYWKDGIEVRLLVSYCYINLTFVDRFWKKIWTVFSFYVLTPVPNRSVLSSKSW